MDTLQNYRWTHGKIDGVIAIYTHPPLYWGGGYKECMKQRQIHVDNATDSETAEATETVRQQQTGR